VLGLLPYKELVGFFSVFPTFFISLNFIVRVTLNF
jgi:hypothetical protein